VDKTGDQLNSKG